MLLLQVIYFAIPCAQKLVSQIIVVDEIPLSAAIMKTVVVARARKIKPLWMTEFVSCPSENEGMFFMFVVTVNKIVRLL